MRIFLRILLEYSEFIIKKRLLPGISIIIMVISVEHYLIKWAKII